VWTFGDGWNGRLGHNDEQQRLVPTLLTAEVLKGSKIVTVAAGGAHTMAVGVNGTLWAWGLGSSSSWAWATPMKGGCRRWWVRRRCLGVPRCARLRPHAGGDGGGRAVGVGQRSARTTGPQRRARQAGADARGPAALCPRTHLRCCRWRIPLGSRDKVHAELFAAALSKRAIMEAWEGGKDGDLQT